MFLTPGAEKETFPKKRLWLVIKALKADVLQDGDEFDLKHTDASLIDPHTTFMLLIPVPCASIAVFLLKCQVNFKWGFMLIMCISINWFGADKLGFVVVSYDWL